MFFHPMRPRPNDPSSTLKTRRAPPALTTAEDDLAVARAEREHLPAAADAPAPHAALGLRLGHGHAVVVDGLAVGLHGRVGAFGQRERDGAVAGARGEAAEVAVERDAAVARARLGVALEVLDADAAVAGLGAQATPGARHVDGAVARAQLDLAAHAVHPQAAVARRDEERRVARDVEVELGRRLRRVRDAPALLAVGVREALVELGADVDL